MAAETIFTAVSTGTFTISSTKTDALRHQNASVFIWGTWGGATATVTVSPDGINFFPFASNTLSVNGYIGIVPTVLVIQVALTGGSGASLSALLD